MPKNKHKTTERLTPVNANKIITDDMTLEEKLKAIEESMKSGAEDFNRKNGRPINAPVDPADLVMCEGCQ